MRAINFLTNISTPDLDDIETVTLQDSFTACKLQELETLQNFSTKTPEEIQQRIVILQKELKNIKYV